MEASIQGASMVIDSETTLIRNRSEVSASVRSRMDPALFEFGGNERLKMVFDLEMHLAFLASAIRCESIELFTEYAIWTHQLLVSTGRDSRPFLACLAAIETELDARGRGDWIQRAREYLGAARRELDATLEMPGSYFDDSNPHRELAERFLQACLALQRAQALAMIHAAVREGVPVREVYLDVITPVLHELGRLWHGNRITVAQEHYCTAVSQMVMAQLFPAVFEEDRKNGRLVSTCVAGELHEIGARMVTDLFEMNGWDTVFLGADVPKESIIDTLIRHDANILAISATLGSNLGDVAELIQAVRASPGCEGIKILVGGAAFNKDSAIWQKVGADGWASDPDQALALAAGWRT
jgi:methanogenic corrinoid protein MtbC1